MHDRAMKKKTSTEQILEDQISSDQTTFFGRLRMYFLAGILVTAPITLTIYLTYLFLATVDRQVVKILPEHIYQYLYGEHSLPGMGLLIAVAFFTFIGWFATIFLGRFFLRLSEWIVGRMPIVRNIYTGLKQVFETVMGSQSQAFREAVLFEFPRKGIWAIGFVTGVARGEVQRLTDDEIVNVFFPTTPNPTSGFLLLVPRKDLVVLQMTPEEAIKMIISGGILTPPDRGDGASSAS